MSLILMYKNPVLQSEHKTGSRRKAALVGNQAAVARARFDQSNCQVVCRGSMEAVAVDRGIDVRNVTAGMASIRTKKVVTS